MLTMAVAFFWGLNFPISKIALRDMDPYTLRAVTCVFALLVYVFFAYPERKQLKYVSTSEYYLLFLLSIPIATIVPLFNLIALSYIESSVAIILVYTMPAMNTLCHCIINKSVKFREFLKMFFCLAGVLFTLNGQIHIGVGEWIILSGALIWAIGGVLNDKYAPKLDGRLSASIQLTFATILTFFVILLLWSFGIEGIDISKYWKNDKTFSLSFWLSVFYIGAIGGGMAFICWFALMKNHGSQYASYSLMLVPVVGVFTSLFITEETLSFSVSFGLVCMMLSVWIGNYDSKR